MNFSPVSFTYTKRNNIYFKSNNDLFTPNTSFSSIVRQPDCFRLSTPGANSHEKYYAAFYDAIQKTDENIDYDTDYVYEKMRSKMDKIKEPNLRERIRKIIEKGFYLHFILEVCKIENNIFVRFPNLEAFVKDFTPDSKYFHRFMMVLNECGINDKSEFVEIVNAFDFKSNRELSRLCYRRPECCIGGYKVANNKELFLKYPDLLAEAYSREKDSDEPDYSSIDRLAEHLFVIGAQNSEDFLQKCGQLAPSFNDFEFQADKLEALEYHQSTYKHKLQLIKQIFDTKGINGVNCEEFYKRNLKYIDCLYEENNGENLGNLDDNIHHFLDKRQIKQSVLNRVQDRFNNFENIKDEIDLYSLLTKTKTSISEFTTLAEETIVDGIHPIDKVLKKNEVVAKIAQIKSISEAKALEIYNKYSSILTLLTTVSSEQQQEYLSIFLERLDDEVFKNQNSVVKFYNLINKKSKISLSQEEVLNIFELLRYSRHIKITEQAKKEHMKPVLFLEKNKTDFEKVQKDIELFLQKNKTNLFAGMSALDVYNKYKDVILKSKNNIEKALTNLVLTSGNTVEYKYKAERIEQLRQYFKTTDDLLEFMELNQIKISKNKNDANSLNSVMFVLGNIFDENNPDESYKLINKLSKSQFLLNSKELINDFARKYSNKLDMGAIFKLIAKKEVLSINVLDDFLSKYQNQDGELENVVRFLNSSSDDFKFSQLDNSLKETEILLDKYASNLKINNDNILNISQWQSLSLEDKENDINSLILSLLGKPDLPNYISCLSKSKKPHVNKVIPYYVANEIINYSKKDNSYTNIVRELKLDRESLGVANYDSEDTYKRALIENIPNEFIEFLSSDEWVLSDNDGYININLHPKLRLIERFALKEVGSIDKLYTKETKEKLKAIQNAVYNTVPEKIENSYDRIKISTPYGDETIISVFAKTGALITIFPQD